MIGGLNGRRHTSLRIALVPAAALFALGAVLIGSHPGGTAPHPVGLVAKEFLFDPKDVSVAPGEIAFLVKNQGVIEHNVALIAPGGKTVPLVAVIEPGQTAKVTISLAPGNYTLYCSLPGHRDAGMAAALRVVPEARPNP